MNFPTAGTYSINFYAAYSTAGNPGNEPLNLYFGGNDIGGTLNTGVFEGSITPASSSQWNPYSISFYVPVAGSYQIAFQNSVTNGNYINAFTDVTETLKTANATINVPNAGFNTGVGNGGYAYNVGGASWTFTGQSGIAANGSGFGTTGSPSGWAGLVQNVGSFSQAFSLAAGTYTLSFFTEGRNGGYGPNPFDVELNGANITSIGTSGVVTPASTSAFNLVTGSFTLSTAGSYTLSFNGIGGASDLTLFITDVSIATGGTGLLPTGTPLSVASGGFFDIGGLSSQTVASLSGAGTVTNSASGTTSLLTVAPSSGSTTFSGVIQNGNGTVGLTMNGSSGTTLALSGTNTYTGGTTVNGGTLRVTSTGALPSAGNVTIGSTGTLALQSSAQTVAALSSAGTLNLASGNSGTNLTVSGGLTLQTGSNTSFVLGTPNGTGGSALIAVTGSITNGGNNTDEISFSNAQIGTYDLFSYTGSTTASAFYLNPASVAAYPTLNEALSTGLSGQIDLVVTSPLIWTGLNGGPHTPWDTGTQNWTNSSGTPSNYIDHGGAVTFADTYPTDGSGDTAPVASSNVYIQSGGVYPSLVKFNNTAVNYTLFDADTTNGILGPANIVINGMGTVTFMSPNGFTGTVSINAGQLNLQNGGALGASSGVIVSSGGALQLQGGITAGSSVPLSISGAGLSASANGALQSVSGANTYAGPINIGIGGATITSSSTASGDGLTLNGGVNLQGNSR